MKKLMKAAAGAAGADKFELEVNPRHPLIIGLYKTRETNADLAEKIANQVYDNARFAAGLLEDPRSMVKRLNSLMEDLVK